MAAMTREQRIAWYEKARSLANIACFSIELQIHRLRKGEPEIPEFVMQPVADFHFLLTAIKRLHRAANLANNAIDRKLSSQIKEFGQSLPDWEKIRNTMEHIDGRWQNGKSKFPASKRELPGFSFSDDLVEWCGVKLNLETVMQASSRLFQAIQDMSPYAKHNKDHG